MTANAIDWRGLMAVELKRLKNNKAALATRIGFSRAYVSRVMNPEGKSGIRVPHQTFIDRVIDRLHVVECPISRQAVRRTECAKANQPAPTHNPMAVQLWRKCQTCPHKPQGGEQ